MALRLESKKVYKKLKYHEAALAQQSKYLNDAKIINLKIENFDLKWNFFFNDSVYVLPPPNPLNELKTHFIAVVNSVILDTFQNV